ncbi:uncharacterized protein LOC127857523 isoform X2 [Dreissena polymorpha]|uniref:Macro domain-containing protein n=1 Tax=Dreissena polymorpha TaxID=45954 RepID=A0A9D3YV95_DREPO|nr:uncharacterized protein LOC127857523 isoform X2 [Dreissena polymorpha]KAH3707698.1 hypothetical protein DPMN_067109 [Dreissena polymorpha]
MAGNVPVFDDEGDPAVGSKEADSLGETDETVLIKEYDSKDAAILKLFFKEELKEISLVGLVKCHPPQGPGLKLLIQSVQKKRARVDPLIKDLDNKLKMIKEREVTVPSDAFAKLAELMRSEEKRQDGAEQKELVLYRPDIVKKIVQVFFWPGNDKAVIKLERELGIIKTGGTPNKYTPSDQAEGRNPSDAGSHLYPDLKASSSGDDHDYEYMECGPSPQPSANPRSDAFVKRFSGTLTLHVYRGSILNLPVDAIVNAANDNMDHGGGVAKVISEAAGCDLDRESKRKISKLPKGLLPVTRNIVTTAGKLKYRGVIHAVGPQWYDSKYRDDKICCLDDLYDTIKNVLETCDRKGYKTVAMPAISAGIYAVPKKLCADMYVRAAAEYSQIHGSKLPKALHIVDIDKEILDLVKKSVENYDKNPELIDQRKTVPDHLASHQQWNRRGRGRGQRGGQVWNGDHGSNKSQVHGSPVASESQLLIDGLPITCEVKKLEDEKFRWGGIAQKYILNKDLTVKIFKGDITRSSHIDALVCGIGPDMKFSGFVDEVLKKAGGYDFQEKIKKKFQKANSFKQGDILSCKPGNLKVGNIVFVVADKLIDVGNTEQKNYRDWVYNLLKKAHEWNFKRIAVPLFSTGQLQTNENKLQKCAIALLQALANFVDNISGRKSSMKEIHLVNNNDLVTRSLVRVFDVASKNHEHNVSKTSSSASKSHWKDAEKGQTTPEHLASSNTDDRHTQQHTTANACFSGSYGSIDRKSKYKKKDLCTSPPKGNDAARVKTQDSIPREGRHYHASSGATGGEGYNEAGEFSDEDDMLPVNSRPKQSSTLHTDNQGTSGNGSLDGSTSTPPVSKGNVQIFED